MAASRPPVAILAAEAPPRARSSSYPEPFDSRMAGREKRALGDLFGLANFGVNLSRIAPGGVSAPRRAHTGPDEFVYALEGRPTLVTAAGRTPLAPGMCAGLRAGTGEAHRLVNETDAIVVFLEIGDRTPGDGAAYPVDDMSAELVEGGWRFSHGDGTPYQGASAPASAA